MCECAAVMHVHDIFVTYCATIYQNVLYIYGVLVLRLCRLSASCVHVSALLYALVALTPIVDARDDSDDKQPVTSLPC